VNQTRTSTFVRSLVEQHHDLRSQKNANATVEQ
jgi:hypothetical protein